MELKVGDKVKITRSPNNSLPPEWRNRPLTGIIRCIQPSYSQPIGVEVDDGGGNGHDLCGSGASIESKNGWWVHLSEVTLLPAPALPVIVISTPPSTNLRIERFPSKEAAETALIGRDYFSYEDMVIIEGGKNLHPYISIIPNWAISSLL